MKTKFIKYIICFFSIIFIVASPALLVSASQNSNNTFIYPCGTPSTGSGTGYLEILVKNKETGVLSSRMFSWNLFELSSTDTYNVADIRINIEFNMSGSNETIKFSAPYIIGNDDVIFGNIYSTIPTGNITFKRINSSDTNYTYSTSGELVGFHVYGNYNLTDNLGIGNQEFYILYAESGAIYNAIQNGQQSQTNQILQGQQQQTDEIIANQDSNTNKINANQDKNTDKIINAGSNVNQPDFGSANNSLDSTTNQMNSIEGSYKIDKTATQNSLNEGKNFIVGTDMQRASIQVKNWIEKFASDNIVMSGFFISVMVLGACFWIIGRKSW